MFGYDFLLLVWCLCMALVVFAASVENRMGTARSARRAREAERRTQELLNQISSSLSSRNPNEQSTNQTPPFNACVIESPRW